MKEEHEMGIHAWVISAATCCLALGAQPSEGQSSWEPYGLDGLRVTDLQSVGPYLYATVLDLDALGQETGIGLFRRYTADAESAWVSLGLSGVKLNRVWVNPAMPDTIVVSTRNPAPSSGSVFRSLDGGASWQRADAGLEPDAGGRVIGSTDDPALLLLAHDAYGIYRTTNLGQTWNLVGYLANDTYRDVAFDAQRPEVAWAVATTGFFGCRIWKSESAGVLSSWTTVHDCPSECCSALRVASDRFTGRVFVTYSHGFDWGVYYTDDGGTSWTLGHVADQFGALALAVPPWGQGHVMVGTSNPKVDPISLSTDRGETWKNYSAGLPAEILAPLDIEADQLTPGVFYVGFKDHGVWRIQVEGVVAVTEAEVPRPLTLSLANNPASGGPAIFRFSGTGEGATLWISDANGRRIRVLRIDDRATGELSWDGRDRSGETVPAGVYFAVLETTRARVASRLVWLGH